MLNYRCKQRQYHSVLWSLQFVLALLHHARKGAARARQQQHERGDAREDNSCRCSTSTDAADTESDALIAFQAAADGALASFAAQGPLSASQLLSLQNSLTDADVRDLCVQCMRHFITQQQQQQQPAPTLTPVQQPLFSAENVFAAPTPLLQVLWPTESVRQHYMWALEVAHHNRIDHSDLLAMPGYLQEAGLHARCVFAGYSGAKHDERFTVAKDSERRAAHEWARLIDLYTSFLPDRSHIHELENLPQEIAIGELLRETVERVRRAEDHAGGDGFALDCVVDVGGGNGFLAAQVAERLQCDSVVIDPFFPAHSIDCCPRLWRDTAQRARPATRRQRTLHRTVALFRDVRWSDAVPAAPARTALIAKHLCGSGVDEVLRHLEAQECLPRILVLAPCCFNKITVDRYCDAAYLRQVMGIDSEEALARVNRLTDWNMSCYQSTHERMLARVEAARRSSATSGRGCACEVQIAMEAVASQALPAVDGSSAAASPPFCYQRRSGPRSIANSITCTHDFALLVEALLNYGRMQWLQQRHYDVHLVQYVPDVVTPKNKCWLAIRQAHTS